jgi:hypothetical protein
MGKRKTSPVEPPPENRNAQGQFVPGTSGNPGGRPKGCEEIISTAKIDSPEAYEKVARIMRDDDHKQQLVAALAILKLAGVLRAVEAPESRPPARPYAQAPTADLLQRASVSSTLPQ